MIGLVIVSHSARLAEGVCELASQVAQGKVRLAPAGGTADSKHPFGTDSVKVLEAVESVYSDEGVLVLMDLGSAVLSAETALDLLTPEKRSRVRLCAAPLIEGAVAAATLAAAGAGMDEIEREANATLASKASHLAAEPRPSIPTKGLPSAERTITLPNALGLHARPAAQLVRMARRHQARIQIENITLNSGPIDAAGISAVLGLGARQGHLLLLRAEGPDALAAVDSIANFLKSGCGEGAETPASAATAAAPEQGGFAGIPASPGIAIGPLARLHPLVIPSTDESAAESGIESQRLAAAIDEARKETQALYEWARTNMGKAESGIFDAQLLFLEDMAAAAMEAVASQPVRAAHAWQVTSRASVSRLAELDDPYLKARAADVADVASRVLAKLLGTQTPSLNLAQPSILAAHDLSPSEVQSLDPQKVVGICLESGSASAHSVILARAMGIPAVVGVGPALSACGEGTAVALDGEQGRIWVSPEPQEIKRLEDRREEWVRSRNEAQKQRKRPAATKDGRRIRVLANISSVAEGIEAIEHGAEGVGVLRTEFLFLGRTEAPDEEEQFAAYRTIAESLDGRPLVVRTLDAGGDKDLPFIDAGREDNPFLGWRGIRLMLGTPDLLCTQVRAILRASVNRPVSLLLPMVSTLDEVREAKAIVATAKADLEREGIAFGSGMPIGTMIEVPAAVVISDQLSREVDFFSIGTNDLIQYTMAADRTNSRVASIADPFQPAILRLIRQAAAAGREAGIEVTVCGELASDPLAIGLLIGLGIEELSLSAGLIPETKRIIARWTMPEAEALVHEALAQDTSSAVRDLLQRR